MKKNLPVKIHFKVLFTMPVNIPLTKANHMTKLEDKGQGKHTPSLQRKLITERVWREKEIFWDQ